jgi:hypothetical protein
MAAVAQRLQQAGRPRIPHRPRAEPRARAPAATGIKSWAGLHQSSLSLFDHLVREGEYVRRNLEPERLGGFQVKNQLEFGRSHNWQVGRFFALENSPDIIACLMKGISQAGPIADKPPIFCCLPCCVTRGQSKARNLVDNDLSIGVQEWAGTHEERPGAPFYQSRNCAVDLLSERFFKMDLMRPSWTGPLLAPRGQARTSRSQRSGNNGGR